MITEVEHTPIVYPLKKGEMLDTAGILRDLRKKHSILRSMNEVEFDDLCEHRARIGNSFDTDWLRQVNCLVVADVKSPFSNWSYILFFWHGKLQVGVDCRKKEDLSEDWQQILADGSNHYYCTCCHEF
jgi:hypothetical protein